jgi:hypothetical protein
MPRPSKVEQLPQELREELDERLVDRGFSGYEELAEWLEENGHAISKSSLGRYGKGFKERLANLRVASAQAKEIVSAMGDDEGAMGEALTSLAQEKAFQVLMDMQAGEQDVPIDRLMKSIAKLGSTDVQQKSFRIEVQERAEEAAQETEEVLREEGLSDDVAEGIRDKILGITE